MHKRSGLNPAVLLGMMPAVPLPADLRRRTLGVIADKTPTAVAYRARVLDRAARFGAGGFPAQVATPSVPGRRVTAVAAVAAAAAALALLGGAMYFAAHASGHPGPSAADRRPPLTGPAGPNGSTRVPAGVPSAGARGPAPGPDPVMRRLGGSGRSPLLGLLGSASAGLPTSGPASAWAATSPSQASAAARSPSPSKSPKPSPAPASSRPASSAPASSAPASSAPASSAAPLPLPSVSVSVSVPLPASAPAGSPSATGGTSN